MQEQLEALQPKLVQSQKETADLMVSSVSASRLPASDLCATQNHLNSNLKLAKLR